LCGRALACVELVITSKTAEAIVDGFFCIFFPKNGDLRIAYVLVHGACLLVNELNNLIERKKTKEQRTTQTNAVTQQQTTTTRTTTTHTK
jgi:hypothetical protein